MIYVEPSYAATPSVRPVQAIFDAAPPRGNTFVQSIMVQWKRVLRNSSARFRGDAMTRFGTLRILEWRRVVQGLAPMLNDGLHSLVRLSAHPKHVARRPQSLCA